MNKELIINNKHYKKAANLESLNMFKGHCHHTKQWPYQKCSPYWSNLQGFKSHCHSFG